ncbi:MAG: PBP1A family penicillin-binding protein [Pseudomonadales bacterium]|nr:PBP1A family penicillin-binding protein [Pseudomonadales bacterium]
MAAAYLYLNPQIPDASEFGNVKIRAPLRIYSADEKLIQEFGERLIPVTYEDIPPLFVRALLDTEDKRFFEHSGIDLITVFNATWQLVRNRGAIRTGASTITMQLVKNISGDTEVRFIRKFKEMLLALKIERELSKEEILTLYLNIIPFGKHAFGAQAAANTYYGKDLSELNLAQIAMLAGIPQAPEAGNPINGPERAVNRRNLVLARMLEQGTINRAQYEEATAAPITAEVHSRTIELPALYAAEMVRQQLYERFGRDMYNNGLLVHTTLDSHKQLAAETALITQLNAYDRRHGYRGPEFREIHGTSEFLAAPEYGYPANWIETLNNARIVGDQHPAIVLRTRDQEMDVLTADLQEITLTWDGLSWARPYINVNSRGARPSSAGQIAGPGDVIRIHQQEDGSWALGQVPAIQGALVSLRPSDGAVLALTGGYDFNARQFNHATQAKRQPGSNFKPFFYAGALENGLTAASIYNDAPVVLPGGEQEEVYRPSNSGDVFHGDIRLREALYRSINLVSLRVILDYGPANAINYVSRFGFDTSNFPQNVQLAFGGGTIALTPMEVATGYAAFANGGYKVEPYLITEVDSINDDPIYIAQPRTVCEDECGDLPAARRIIEPRVAYIMNSILGDVVRRGTGTKARRALKRDDLKGKTGTTNDADIWFSGFTHDLVATTWVGFGDNSPVGANEWGSTAPLETWIAYMREALPPESESTELPLPDGLVSVRIDPATGKRADPADPDAIFEFFREEYAPAPDTAIARKDEEVSEPIQQIF